MFVSARSTLVLLCVGLGLACEAQSPPGSAALASEGYLESSDGVSLYYRTIGAASDTIIVLHGGPGLDQGYLAPDLEPLAETSTLLFYDQRGAGRSTVVSDSALLRFEAHVADLEAVRRRLGIRRMALLGHSWGALLAAGYAREYPENVSLLVLVSPGPLRRDPYEADFFARATAWMDSATLAELNRLEADWRGGAIDARAACARYFGLWFRGGFADPMDTAMYQRRRGDPCTAPEAAIRNQPLVSSLSMPEDWDWREDFRGSDLPVLILAGEQDVDPAEAYQEWVAAFPHAQLVTVPQAGHFSFVEQPERFFSAVAEFMRANRSPR
jgi:proline iminopeptidase